MIGLKLRDEFLGSNMPGTAIELRTDDKRGAVDQKADYILSITYPTTDVITALRAISDKQFGRPIVLKGERGRGKSHIMALMHHAIATPDVVEAWLASWAARGKSELTDIKLLQGYLPISEAVHNYEFPLLWDLLFERHQKGAYYRGQFEGMNQPVPPRSLLERMFADQKVCLILDEFQTWYKSLPQEKNGVPVRDNAFNFIQILSEIAKDSPDKLIFVVSVLDNNNDAYTQIHRQNPISIDFLGAQAKEERQKLLLHRLFDNRGNIAVTDIQSLCDAYAKERIRLVYANQTPAEKERLQNEVYACWPFSPELLTLLEEQILVSTVSQETRDLIKILAQVYKSRGEHSPIITPADFFVDGENDEVQTLITSIAANPNPEKMRKIAQINLSAITITAPQLKYVRELVSDIWMHSLFFDSTSGVDTNRLHLEITRNKVIDDNTFQIELAGLIDNSTHIFGGDSSAPVIKFSLEENPNSKVRSFAKNQNLWAANAVSSGAQQVYPAKDIEHIRKTLISIFSPETTATTAKIIVLGPQWRTHPWDEIDDNDKPQNWDRPVLLAIPENIEGGKEPFGTILGTWLKEHLNRRRNTIRFLLTQKNLFNDSDLVFLSRCSYLCSKQVWGQDRTYSALYHEYHSKLENTLKVRFDHFALLQKWDYQNPEKCSFDLQHISEQGKEIPKSVEETLLQNHFDYADFKEIVIQGAKDTILIKDIIEQIVEPPPPTVPGVIIPYLAENKICELIFKVAAEGEIAINAKGTWFARRSEDIDDESAFRFIRGSAFKTLNEMKEYQLALPGAAGGSAIGSSPQKAYPPSTGGLFGDGSTPPPQSPSGGSPVGVTPQPSTNGFVPPTPTFAPKIPVRKTAAPNNVINQMGLFETWNISGDKTIETTTLEFSGLTVQQIKQILQRIPSSYQVGLSIDYEEGGQS